VQSYKKSCIPCILFSSLVLVSVEVRPIEDRIKELCERAATAEDSEVPELLAELKKLLAEHSASVRYLAAKTLSRFRAA